MIPEDTAISNPEQFRIWLQKPRIILFMTILQNVEQELCYSGSYYRHDITEEQITVALEKAEQRSKLDSGF